MEGYLYDRDEAKAAFRHAAQVAHRHDRLVSLTLSDSFCVDRHRDRLPGARHRRGRPAVRQRATSWSRCTRSTRSTRRSSGCSADCQLAVVTVGARGCLVVTPDGVLHAPAEPVERVLDTTGAGDLFAAGFLYGYTRAVAGRVRPHRFDRRCRGHLARRSPPARRAAHADLTRAAVPARRRPEVPRCPTPARRRRTLARRRARRRPARRAAGAARRPRRRARRALRRAPAVRDGRAARRGGRRPAADEPAGGAPGRGRPGRYLLATMPDAAERGVIIGFDARRKSDVVRARHRAGVRGAWRAALLFDRWCPRPVLAWNITGGSVRPPG
jgi:hypothetical protein